MLKIISERDPKFYDDGEEKISEKENEERNGKKEEDAEFKSELENELILLGFFEQRLQFILLSLTKLNINRNDSKKGFVSDKLVFVGLIDHRI